MRNLLNKIKALALSNEARKQGGGVVFIDCQTRQVDKCTLEEWDEVYSQITVTEPDGFKRKYMKIDTIKKDEPTDYEYQFAKAINDFGTENFEMKQYSPGKWTSKIKQ
jgi:hypothetical protein